MTKVNRQQYQGVKRKPAREPITRGTPRPRASRREREGQPSQPLAVEVLPQTRFSKLRTNKLAPSLVVALIKTTWLVSKPLIAVALGVVLAFSVSRHLQFGASEPLIGDDPALLAEVEVALAAESASEVPEIAFQAVPAPPTASAQEKLNTMNFIAGLISVYRPSIKDCGTVARHIVEVAAEKNVDPLYVTAIISVESRFGIWARSSVGALGLMQLLPKTAKEMSEITTGKKAYPSLTNPRTNIELGTEYIKRLEHQYHGNRYMALAAYNWGMANVNKVLKNQATMPKSVQRYASKILERTLAWNRHYKRAKKSAKKLEQAA